MDEFFKDSLFFGLFLSIFFYFIGMILNNLIKKKIHMSILNPLLFSVICIITLLAVTKTSYSTYENGAKFLSTFLTPATICLAIPLYEKFELLKKNFIPIILGIVSGVLTSLVSVYLLSLAFNLDHKTYVTLIPHSITTAIGIGVSDSLNGYTTIAVAIIIVTGILGSLFGSMICKMCRIDDPIARGVAFGTSSHAVGTSRALELGETEGAISGLSLVIAGILTVFLSMFFSNLI